MPSSQPKPACWLVESTPEQRKSLQSDLALTRGVRAASYVAGALLILAGLAIQVVHQFKDRGTGATLLFLGAALWLFSLQFQVRRSSHNMPEQDWLLDDPDDDLGELVDIAIYQNGVLTGRDRGMMTVIDNAAVFLGQRCNFTLASQDLKRYVASRDGAPDQASETSELLELKHPHRRIVVSITTVEQQLSDSPVRRPLLRELEGLHASPESKEVHS